MRKLLVILSLMLAFPASALAEAPPLKTPPWANFKLEKPKLKFQKKKLWNLAALPAYFLLETTIHEGSHGLMAKSYGQKITAFKPYPHYEPGTYVSTHTTYAPGRRTVGVDWQPGVVFFGSMYYRGRTLAPGEDAMVTAAPYLADMTLFIVTDLILSGYLIDPNSVAGLILYTAGMVVPFVNFTYNAHNVKEYSDFGHLSALIGKNNFAAQALFHVGVRALILAAVWRLWVRGREVLFDSVLKEKPNRVTVVPFVGSMNGAGMGLQF